MDGIHEMRAFGVVALGLTTDVHTGSVERTDDRFNHGELYTRGAPERLPPNRKRLHDAE